MLKNEKLKGKNVLFFSPSFFGYENKIANKMKDLGANVYLYDERSIKDSFSKALLKVSPSIFNSKSKKYYNKILDDIRNVKFDYILVIKCEMMPVSIIQAIKQQFGDAKLYLYLWDSVKNVKGLKNKLSYFDKVYSFDRMDCQKYGFQLRPLFFADEYIKEPNPNQDYKYDISFLGTIHSDRYKIIKKIEKIAKEQGMKCYWYKFLQSKFIYYYYKVTKKEFRGTTLEDFDYKKKSGVELSRIVDESKVILDVQHPRQVGLTMRTIEMLGMNKKVITTNADIKNYDFYCKDNIFIINRNNAVINKDFVESKYVPIDEKIYEKYSLTSWVLDILN